MLALAGRYVASTGVDTGLLSNRREGGVVRLTGELPPVGEVIGVGVSVLTSDIVRLLRRYLRDRWKDTDALFPTWSSDRLTTRSLQRFVKKLAAEAEVQPQVAGSGDGETDDVTPTLRHSVAYRIIQGDGGRLEAVQLRLRHANRQTTDQIYSHLVPR